MYEDCTAVNPSLRLHLITTNKQTWNPPRCYLFDFLEQSDQLEAWLLEGGAQHRQLVQNAAQAPHVTLQHAWAIVCTRVMAYKWAHTDSVFRCCCCGWGSRFQVARLVHSLRVPSTRSPVPRLLRETCTAVYPPAYTRAKRTHEIALATKLPSINLRQKFNESIGSPTTLSADQFRKKKSKPITQSTPIVHLGVGEIGVFAEAPAQPEVADLDLGFGRDKNVGGLPQQNDK